MSRALATAGCTAARFKQVQPGFDGVLVERPGPQVCVCAVRLPPAALPTHRPTPVCAAHPSTTLPAHPPTHPSWQPGRGRRGPSGAGLYPGSLCAGRGCANTRRRCPPRAGAAAARPPPPLPAPAPASLQAGKVGGVGGWGRRWRREGWSGSRQAAHSCRERGGAAMMAPHARTRHKVDVQLCNLPVGQARSTVARVGCAQLLATHERLAASGRVAGGQLGQRCGWATND